MILSARGGLGEVRRNGPGVIHIFEPYLRQAFAEWQENLVPADAEGLVVHRGERANGQLELEAVLFVDALELRQLTEVDTGDVPPARFQRLHEVPAPGKSAVLRVAAAALVGEAVHLP